MAGGASPSLWPMSIKELPKQFQSWVGVNTLLQDTFERLTNLFDIKDIFVVTSQKYGEIVRIQIRELPEENLILEPYARHTMPCVALALTVLATKVTDDTVVSVFPSDHYIKNLGDFIERLETAINFARQRDAIVAIGITPTRPETNYGYIQVDNEQRDLGEFFARGIRYSKTFAEKPDIDTAKRFLASNEFLWNTGIFVWKVSTFWNSLRTCSYEIYNYFNVLKKFVSKKEFPNAVEDVYRQIPSISLDFGILEVARNVFVVESNFSWSDIGTWDEVYRLAFKDDKNNHIVGDVIAIDTKNSLIRSYEKIIAAIEIEDLIVVDTPRAILLCRRGASNRIIEVINYLRLKNADLVL